MKIIKYIVIFVLSLIICDIILSSFFEKEVYNLLNHKLKIIPKEKSRKDPSNIYLKWSEKNIPYWENDEYRWPLFNYNINKKLNCRILWIWDSIIWWSWVKWNETYLYNIQKKLINTEVIDLWVPGFDILQEIVKFNESKLWDDTDLLIWHIWEDDDHIYKLINWILYNSEIEKYVFNWVPKLFSFLNDNLNKFLLKNSYLYNKLLFIKLKNNIKRENISNIDYIINKLDKVFKDYLKKWKNKKILLIFSPSLENNTYRWKHWNVNWYPRFYKQIEQKFISNKNINILYLDNFFKWINVKDIRYDNCCHFNKLWHEIIADKLYKYIKTNKLLDEKCY